MTAITSQIKSYFPCHKAASIKLDPLHDTDSIEKIEEWVKISGVVCDRLTNLLDHISLYSLLKEELIKASECIKAGEKWTHLSLPLDAYPLQKNIENVVHTQLKKLQDLSSQAKGACSRNEESIAEDKRVAEKWRELRLPESVLENHADCARFLTNSGLIYSIIGYLETSQDREMHGLKLNEEGRPFIKMQGKWTRWDCVKGHVKYDARAEAIVSIEDDEKKWNYFHAQGLVPVDRMHYDAAFPIYRLSTQEYGRLVEHSQLFYETNPEKDIGVEKNCVVQFFTSPRRRGIPDIPFLANLHNALPVHVGIRLITANRDVYSFGINVPLVESRKIHVSTFFSTADARIGMRDYEEFREHEGRVVTSIPLSGQRAQNILHRVNELNARQMRYHFTQQNCASLMLETIQEAGYDIDIRSTAGAEIWAALPNANQLPLIGPLIGKVERVIGRIWSAIVNATPQCIRDGFSWLDYVVLYIPRKLGTIMTNLILLIFGGSQYLSPLAYGTPEESLFNDKRMHRFSTVIRSWKDIFRDETSFVNHSRFLVDWQRKQRSTHTFAPKERPSLCIVPPPTA